MTALTAASPRRRSLKRVAQQASHANLSQDVSTSLPPSLRSRTGRLDAIIVPATRPASSLQPVIELAASLDTLLVVLCSRLTRVEHVARVANRSGARCLIVPIDEEWTHQSFPTRTSGEQFHSANAGRSSDLSLKRNLGLLLARLHGWNKVAFIDDDIRLTRTDNIVRLAGQLEAHQVAGMVVRKFPDNSVVCHARRLAGLSQDVFITGAVLGVHCNNLPLSFFPDIYNEDWFFFAEEAARRILPRVGQAVQTEYDPFARSERARCEEFGDLLAEGLFAYFDGCDQSERFDKVLSGATLSYWSRFIEARREVLLEARTRLLRFADQDPGEYRVLCALDSLAAAQDQLDKTITPDLCLDFIAAWRDDRRDWQRTSVRVNNVGSTREAMDFLQLKAWKFVSYRDAEVDEASSGQRAPGLVNA